MIQLRMTKQISHRTGHSRFVVPRAENHSLDARENDRARAHRARLERDVERAVVKAPAVELLGGLADSETLGVSGRILIANGTVGGDREDRAVMNDDSAHGNFVALHRLAREIERVANELLVVGVGIR